MLTGQNREVKPGLALGRLSVSESPAVDWFLSETRATSIAIGALVLATATCPPSTAPI
jgi:hypothetical protein